MALVSIRDVFLSFGEHPLLDGVNMQLEKGERVALVGRNGEGKSTLLKLVAQELEPDTGTAELSPQTRLGYLPQQVPDELAGTVRDVISTGLADTASASDGSHAVDKTLSLVQLDPTADFAAMSAGMKRRVLLARALVRDPELLLLDEPTNHLDIDAIDWLEQLLLRRQQALFFVTHDRVFLQRIATRIVELDRGALGDWRCDFARYVVRKQQTLSDQAQQWAKQDKKLNQEETWLRQGLKARRTRNEGRARALERLRAERRARRQRVGQVKLTVQQAERSGKLVIEARQITAGYDTTAVVQDLSTLILRGDRVGIIGPNNCGKTTLLQTLLGQLAPLGGQLRLGTKLQIAYFDQLRDQLDEDQTVADNVAHGAEHLSIGGGRRHVLGYLQDFLFPPARARSPVRSLSGGERSRLLLAKMFTKPSNVLVLDEPTNDLDVETLELLEARLLEYTGTVLLVSHDRALLNNVVTSTLVFEALGRVCEYPGGYDDWCDQRSATNTPQSPTPRGETSAGRAAKPRTRDPHKLTFKQQRELDGLPGRIEQLESEQQQLQDKLSDPTFYQSEGTEIAQVKERLEAVGRELEAAFERWQQLEEIGQGQ